MRRAHHVLICVVTSAVFAILVSIFYRNYSTSIAVINSDYETKHAMVEESVYSALQYADLTGMIAESQLTRSMEMYSQVMLDKYGQNPDVYTWDLDAMQKQFDGYEIYVIDRNLKVIMTTFEADLGLDFSGFPAFSRLLRSRMDGDTFVADRLDSSTLTGELMRYSYMPTPDHRYLLELGVNVGKRFPELSNLSVFSIADNLTDQYEDLEAVTIFKFNEDGSSIGAFGTVDGKTDYDTELQADEKLLIQRVITSNEQVETVSDDAASIRKTCKYIPYLKYHDNGHLNWWNSYVIRLVYDDSVMVGEVRRQDVRFWHSMGLIALLYVCFLFIILTLLRKSEAMAYRDPLTNLANRALFERLLDNQTAASKKNGNKLAVLFVDLNDFKEVNDTLGHAMGDRLLQSVAARLQENLRKNDVVSRLGGDEFTILLSDIDSAENALQVTQKLRGVFQTPFLVDGHELKVQPSIGISVFPDDGIEPKELMNKADTAMYHAKRNALSCIAYSELQ